MAVATEVARLRRATDELVAGVTADLKAKGGISPADRADAAGRNRALHAGAGRTAWQAQLALKRKRRRKPAASKDGGEFRADQAA
jgi:hypothetical protein